MFRLSRLYFHGGRCGFQLFVDFNDHVVDHFAEFFFFLLFEFFWVDLRFLLLLNDEFHGLLDLLEGLVHHRIQVSKIKVVLG